MGKEMKKNYEKELMDQLRRKGKLDLAQVREKLQISESTARRLFAKMQQEGKIIRVHGGIQLPGKNPQDYSFEKLVKNKLREKEQIAVAACDLLEEGDVIFCDTGTTVMCFCMELLHRMDRHAMGIQVYTNSLANFEILADKVPVTLIGGNYRGHRKDFAGYLAETALEKVHFTKCFLGTDGCDGNKFFTTTDFDTARLDEIAIRNSGQTIILCTSDKLSARSRVGFAEFGTVDRVITDPDLEQEKSELLRKAGIVVVTAGEE